MLIDGEDVHARDLGQLCIEILVPVLEILGSHQLDVVLLIELDEVETALRP